jgi:predicted transcriptional regulator
VNCPVPGLGPLEAAIMTAIWDAAQPLTVRAARDRLGYRKGDGETPAYTTVMTVMNILWRKELLTRAKNPQDGDPRAWWYGPRITRDDHLAAVIRHALDCAPDPMAVLGRAVAASGPQIIDGEQRFPSAGSPGDLPQAALPRSC